MFHVCVHTRERLKTGPNSATLPYNTQFVPSKLLKKLTLNIEGIYYTLKMEAAGSSETFAVT